MTQFSLKKTAVVTNGASGIGKANSLKFKKKGALVCILEIQLEAAQATAGIIITVGGKASAYKCNVANQQEV